MLVSYLALSSRYLVILKDDSAIMILHKGCSIIFLSVISILAN